MPAAATGTVAVRRPDPGGQSRRRIPPDVGGSLAWASFVALALVVGTLAVRHWPAGLGAAPLDGRWDWHPGVGLLPALALGLATVRYGLRVAAGLSDRALPVVAGSTTVAWTVALATADGWRHVTAPLTTRHEYLAAIDRMAAPREFLRTYTDRLDGYPVHLKGHPPGMPLLLWALDRAGLGGPGWAAVLVLGGAAAATAAVVVTVRSVAGIEAARRAAPFVAVAPAALWLGTSADAVFAGVGAVGCALVATGRRPGTHWVGGVVLGSALFLTYGTVPLLVIPIGVAVGRGDLRPLVRAAGGIVVVVLAFRAAGFWWFDGLAATRHHYEIGIAQHRPYPLFAGLMNPAAVALATGPAVAAALPGVGRSISAARHAPGLVWRRARRRQHAAPAGDSTRRVIVLEVATAMPPSSAFPANRSAGDSPTTRGVVRASPGAARRHRRDLAEHLPLPNLPLAGLAAGVLGAVVVANLSGMSKGEVERIWLPFAVWLLAATAALPPRRAHLWLGAQLALALVLQMSVDSPW